MKEQQKYDVIKELIETNGNKDRAALKLDCTKRHINRMISGYRAEGKNFFLHGNHGRQPSHTFPDDKIYAVLDLYRTKYIDANFSHFSELLKEHENIAVSTSAIRSILMNADILSPRATRTTKKRIRLHLEAQKEAAVSKKELEKIEKNLILLEDAHPRRPRCAFFGEMIQMDASTYCWFGSDEAHLHIAIDDSTSTIVGAYFDNQETLNGYYNVFCQILKTHGIPYMFYTDRRTIFEYKQRKSTSIEADTFTQFSYACKQLGVQIETTSVPQAKGRVERIFETLQSRLPIELRLAGATAIEQANIFLASYIQKYNARFALPINNTKTVFEKQPDDEMINLTLAVISNRKIDSGHCVRIDNSYFKPIDSNGKPVYYNKGTSALVIKAFDGKKYAAVNEKVYMLDEVPVHERTSRNFDFPIIAEKSRKVYIPSMSHPWRQSSFSSFVNKGKPKYEQAEERDNSQAVSF